MMHAKTWLAMVGVIALLGMAAGTASAGRLSIASQTFRATFRSMRFESALASATCPLTIEGLFHAQTVAKVAGSLIGFITRGAVGRCSAGEAVLLSGALPWHLRYAGFAGTLPAITSIRTYVIGWAMQIREPFFGSICLMISESSHPVAMTLNRDTFGFGALVTAELGGSIAASCEAPGTLSSDIGPVTQLNSISRITVTLI